MLTVDGICEAISGRDSERIKSGCKALIKRADLLTGDDIALVATAIANSGDLLILPSRMGRLADVPSTGGPASLSTLLCPLILATFGLTVPKISATGSVAGAVDSFGLLRGFQTDLSAEEFREALGRCGFAHIEQTSSLCPADAVLISLRRRYSLMRHPALAAASLLAKKVAVPGTAATFDFRIGPSGNIADDFDGGRAVARLFHEVADKLGILCAVVLTDNRSFPSSALGRLESLALVWELLNGGAMPSQLDKQHLAECISIAAVCFGLVLGKGNAPTPEVIESRIRDGSVKSTLIAHLEAQGASLAALDEVLNIRTEAHRVTLTAPSAGYWKAPPLDDAKEWIKREQDEFTKTRRRNQGGANLQVGIRLLATPGEWVEKDQPVVDVRVPRDSAVAIPAALLRGQITTDLATYGRLDPIDV